MAIFAAVFGLVSRFFGKVLTTTLGWASTLLFGRVPASRQVVLAALTFGSVVWVVVLVGVVVPDVGTFLLTFVPGQDVVPEWAIRVAMLIAALTIPAVVGGLTLILADGPTTPRATVEAVARGYPLTALLAGLLVFLAGLAIVRKARSLARGRTDAHVPLVVKPGAYEHVANDLDDAVTAAGLEVEPRPASAAMSVPARWLAAVAGTARGGLVPDRMVQLVGPDIDILIYPMDVLISGKARQVTRARAAIASRLTTSHAHLTVSAEAQELEDRVSGLARADDGPACGDDVAAEFAAIDGALAELDIPYEEWEIVYRQRLQVERDLRAAAMAAVPPVVPGLVPRVVDAIDSTLRDPEVSGALDRATGREWRVAVALTSMAAAIVGTLLRRRERSEARRG